MRRTQHAPKMGTIVAALLIVIVGVLGTFGHLIPSVAGVRGETFGVAAFVLATGILLLGVFFRRI